jgi:acyl carrier protein
LNKKKYSYLQHKINLKLLLTKNVKTMSEIASKVQAIIVDKLGVDASEVTPEANFTNDLGADSLDTVELIMEFEKEFNIAIPDEQAEGIATVGDAISYIEKNSK